MRAGGCPLPALTPPGPADPSAVDFAEIPPGSSLQSGLKLLPKSTWIQRRRRCLLLWRFCSSPLGLSWGRPKASSPQVSGRGGVRSSDECPRPGARQGWSRLLSRAGGQGFGGSFRDPGWGYRAEGEMSPDFVPGGTRGTGLGATGASKFPRRDPLFLAEDRSGRRRAGLCGSARDSAFLGERGASASGAGCTAPGKREGKSSYDSGDCYSVARSAGLLLSAARAFQKTFPGEAIVRKVETRRE